MLDGDFNAPALRKSLREVVAEYEAKRASASGLAPEFEALVQRINSAACMGGAYQGSPFHSAPSLSIKEFEAILLKSAWLHVYQGLNIDHIASAKDRSRFELALNNPPEFTLDNITATFGHYLSDQRFHILKGLAECFTRLDPAYRSHSKVRIGVKGLPKRIVIRAAITEFGTGYGAEYLRDTLNALRSYRGQQHLAPQEVSGLIAFAKANMHGIQEWQAGKRYRSNDFIRHEGKTYRKIGYSSTRETFQIGTESQKGDWAEFVNPEPSVEIRAFLNGNAHVIFDKRSLLDINRALAEFYGEVLPDAPEDDARKRPGTDLCADLQYYPSPEPVIERLLRECYIEPGALVLEPSCGDGRILDAIRAKFPEATIQGIEVHPGRAQEAAAKGHSVLAKNFLETIPSQHFDFIFMNPPFSGTHWLKHVAHAFAWLKEGGQLRAILPATAWYDHKAEIEAIYPKPRWEDLPTASFHESGTNIPTGILTLRK